MICAYLLIINIAGALINIIDKRRAIRDKRRIPEKRLWLVALLGGAIGSFVTMKAIRHKTRHKQFMYGMPALIILQIAVCAVAECIFLGWR